MNPAYVPLVADLLRGSGVRVCSVRADFVKTSTGFGPGGATVEDVELMRRVVGARTGVKAAGGIRTYKDALAMITAGANRIGTSAGVTILHEAREKEHNHE